jgi:RimJ/RimL family protein N-acetyltransferase
VKRVVVGDKQRVADWVSEKIGCSKWHSDFEALGLEMDGVLVAGVVVDGYVENARCSMHVAGEGRRWLNREFIRVCFDYVFRQLRCKVVLGPVSSANEAALRFDKHLGFTEVGRVPEGSADGDLVILKMTKADCRWLEKKT